jgi:formylglycine-generating enzyme required for sulfatase activity
VGEVGLGRAAAQEVTDALLAACRNRSLLPTIQRDAGFSLGRTGWTPDDLDAFIPIPAGPFLYGYDKRIVVIEQPFEIAKYPVTNLQYRRFVEADGYNRREFWSEEGWGWRSGKSEAGPVGGGDQEDEDYLKSWLAGRPPEKRTEPFCWRDAELNNPLAPVVGVSWFEAEAYCHWLSQKLRLLVRLPIEEEWERSARHTDGREYPWGDKFEYNRLNSEESWVENIIDASPTITGQFPDGNTVSGIVDMSGNVWEWTNSWFDNDKGTRIVRGGSYLYDRGCCRTSYRNRYRSDFFGMPLGFRVVRSP